MRYIPLLLTALLFSTPTMADTIYTYSINASYADNAGGTGTYSGIFQYDATIQQVISVSGTLSDTQFGTSQTTWDYIAAYNAANGYSDTGFDYSAAYGYPANEFTDFFMNGTDFSNYTDFVQVLIAGIGTSTPSLDGISLGTGASPGNTIGVYQYALVSGSITTIAVSSSVPEPATYALLAIGLLGFGLTRKKHYARS